ncbi:MAG: 50S ribosomal protein L3 [Patescibacteria group bacterium]|nr:50S ribosomal protein L3 [Patescibacteria group bacterium]
MRALITQKLEMTHIFNESGEFVPVTILLATPNTVVQVKSVENDGYDAVQLGFGEKKKHPKPLVGHLKKANSKARKLVEFLPEEGKEYKIGDKVGADIFNEGEKVIVSGISKGKGFAGTIKRHNFHRGPMTHGSRNHRAPGSIGAGYPQHVFKGQKLAGRMGVEKVTVKNLKIVKVIPEENLILVKGAVPGPKKGFILVSTIEEKKVTPSSKDES